MAIATLDSALDQGSPTGGLWAARVMQAINLQPPGYVPLSLWRKGMTHLPAIEQEVGAPMCTVQWEEVRKHPGIHSVQPTGVMATSSASGRA